MGVKARIKAARQGQPELVRIPVVYRSMGWGCECPDNFIGTSTGTKEGPWIKIVGPVGLPYRYEQRLGTSAVAEGVFTGKQVTEDLRGGPDGPKDYIYKLWEFKPRLMRRLRDGRDADARLHVLLDGAQNARKVAPLTGDKKWLVIINSLPLADKRSARRAETIKQKLIAKGFAGAEVFDSRAASKLFCCYRVVVAGRFASKKEARAAAKLARRARFRGVYVKQGW